MINARLEELRLKFQENPRRYFAPFANELRKSGDLTQAISVCRANMASQPGHVSGHIVLGQALYEAGESDEARGIFTAALELDPENLIALRSLGEIAQVNGEFTAARQWYERLLDADPRNTEVSQLLRDIPTAAAPAVIAPLPEVEDIPRPDQRVEERVVEPAPTPRFHTTFSGSGPAYKSRDEESASEDRTQEAAEPVSADADTSAELPAETKPVTIGASAEPADAMDLLDIEDFQIGGAQPDAEMPQTPDESLETAALHVSDEDGEIGFQSDDVYSKTAALAEELELTELPPQAGHEGEQVADAEPSAEPTEPVRAFFAERGFDGPADDQVGWMTTPSASLSDLESAPEDWYDESPVAEAESSRDVAAEPPAEEPNAVEAVAPDPSVDSWFNEVEGAAAIDATQVTTDEFWLPPELPTAVFAPIATPGIEPEFVAELPSMESAEEADLSEPTAFPVLSSPEPPAAEEVGYTERASVEDESSPVFAEAESTLQPPEESAPSTWSEPLEPRFVESYASAEEFTTEDRVESDVEFAADAPVDDSGQVSMGSVAEEPIQAAAEGWTEPEGETAHESIQGAAEGWPEPDGETSHEPIQAAAEGWPESVGETTHEPTEAAAEGWQESASETAHEPIGAAEGWTEPERETTDEPIQAAAEGWTEPASETAHEPIEAAEGWTEYAYETSLEPIQADAEGWPEPASEISLEPVEVDAEGWPEPVGETLHEPALSMGHTPAFIDAVPTTPPAPFVTETLAELYLQQGFRDEALAIYRQLAERDPSDELLKERIAAIEKPAVVEEPPAPATSTWSDPTSQSVRTFFSRLARRPAVPGTMAGSPAPSDVSIAASPDVPFAAAASALANLFAASKPPASDEGAASTLAGAFTDPAGRPSRAAERELSLDHLFRDVPPAEPSGGVSLDEFFATPNASPGSPTEPGEAGGPGEQGGTDIRQFTAWLEGLRKK